MALRYSDDLAGYSVAMTLEEALQLSGALAMVMAAARNMLSDGQIDEVSATLERASTILDRQIDGLQEAILHRAYARADRA